ncbi:DUF5064 family protein [Pseudomonas sp. MIL19]|uniref:DUF5064 family protein n=1 Tax=Pseudomonas sp. MIL19 TaxID=2976979 RepID=UPI001D2EECD1|nr:DUF5064 family protein [Pseudomonas sp. MIL19]MBU0809709.1 DUF5064 family protein [Gammaproteobacteria bacterium]MBU0883053.1 DUF5064 family protein [Gammaproteobacteria bacterium]MBU1860666.1 DUF5064 family protein [Gammaproteobacteria bacterium]MDD2159564.1 DUF5064 family protein [Pseudomonas sp. MIL19]
MFEPGHLHRANSIATAEMPLFSVDLYYEVRQDPSEGAMLHMRMQGQVDGKAFEEVFELHRDTAYNFASVASRLGHKHGLPTNSSLIMRSHSEFDQMFEDIRAKLGAHSGEPVNLDHLQKDGL